MYYLCYQGKNTCMLYWQNGVTTYAQLDEKNSKNWDLFVIMWRHRAIGYHSLSITVSLIFLLQMCLPRRIVFAVLSSKATPIEPTTRSQFFTKKSKSKRELWGCARTLIKTEHLMKKVWDTLAFFFLRATASIQRILEKVISIKYPCAVKTKQNRTPEAATTFTDLRPRFAIFPLRLFLSFQWIFFFFCPVQGRKRAERKRRHSPGRRLPNLRR